FRVLPLEDLRVLWGADSQAVQTVSLAADPESGSNQLPGYLKYKDLNLTRLKAYLSEKDSLLAEEPYFTTIVDSSREFNVNPLVLFAIAGHEQGFVPKAGPNSARIINNPFNVFHSWKEYNTNIRDSSRIAARTVVHAAEGRPQQSNPFLWINRRYAEDTNWWKGVSGIYAQLEEVQE
ncbi:MAG TPA: hypothetical protein VHS59_05420, partial [Bacillota bacterium]|nr:hypothetical protein [Bacillota bacterium]